VSLLARYADRITLVLDGDEAGQRRTGEVLELFVSSQIDLRIVTLPGGLDPCDFVIQRGAAAFHALVEAAADALEYQVRTLVRGFDPAVDTHQANQALEQILETISKAPRLRTDTTTAFRLREQQTLSRLARDFRVEEPLLRERLTALRRKMPAAATSAGPPLQHDAGLDTWQRELFALLIRNPAAVEVVLESIVEDDLESSLARDLLAMYRRLAAAGIAADYHRLLDEVEEPRLKNLLVDLDEAGQRIDESDFELQLRDVLDSFRRRRHARARRARLAKLETGNLDENEQLQLLAQLIEEERNRQGISAPTDG
jgi:DNA primase